MYGPVQRNVPGDLPVDVLKTSTGVFFSASQPATRIDAESDDDGRTRLPECGGYEPLARGAPRVRSDELAERRQRRQVGECDRAESAEPKTVLELVAMTRSTGARVTALAPLDAHHLAIASGEDGVLEIWDLAEPLRDPQIVGGHGGLVTGMVAADGHLVTTGTDHRVVRWSHTGGNLAPALLGEHRAGASNPAVLADARVATSGHDCRILIWNLCSPGGEPLELGFHAGGVNALAASAFGQVASAGHDGRVLVWDLVKAHDIPIKLLGLRSWTFAMTFLSDGRLVTANGPMGTVWVWEVLGGEARGTRLGSHGDWALSAVALPNGGFLTAGGRRLTVWDPTRRGHLVSTSLEHDSWVAACALEAEGVATAGASGLLQQWTVGKVAQQYGSVVESLAE